ncbi:MAG: GNAT family N-acetyltransferase [Nannocystaceae bacterium]|nr:GNAT family N-acetyltransferase [bacterium]
MLHGPIPLHPTIERANFDSGKESLDQWFRDHALQAHRAGSTRVFVVHDDNDAAVAFYALSAGSVAPAETPARVKKGLGSHPVPVALLTRLAVATSSQGQKLGQALLKDALRRVDAASGQLGVRCLLAHAKDEEAKAFYMHFGFEPSPVHELWLFLLMKDLRKQMGKG